MEAQTGRIPLFRSAMKTIASGVLMISSTSAFGAEVICSEGMAGEHPCSEIHMAAKVPLGTSGLEATSGNDIWGWTDPMTGREYALMGMSSKTAFVDVTDPNNPVHVGDLPTATVASTWRDVKVYQNHAFVVSEAPSHGMQVFDLTRLRSVEDMPATFVADAHYSHFGSSHNIVINEDSGFAYSVGSNTCDAGMHVVDIRDPLNPTFSTCIDRTIFDDIETIRPLHGEDYTHDAQCVIYKGPDARFSGRELCFCSNADTVNIVDVTDKSAPFQISVTRYNGRGYTHQGWLTEDHRYFLLGDELDEARFDHKTKTLIWDMADLMAPSHFASYFSTENAIDHNMYVRGDLVFQANYDAGLRILDLENIADGELAEVGFFDTEPESNRATFDGAWSVYPYFASGNIIVSNIDSDLYVLRPSDTIQARFID